jgi:Rad3-related DNA helicase
VIRSFSGKKNAILQSPTGTGKTICLLCASIGWVMHQYIKNPGLGRIPIVYMSRTHSQLKQVIKELKQISYQPKTTIIGSRDQLCVNQNISNLSVRFTPVFLMFSVLKKPSGKRQRWGLPKLEKRKRADWSQKLPILPLIDGQNGHH